MSSTSHTKHQETQPTWKWDVHADGVIFSYWSEYPSPTPGTPGTTQNHPRQEKPSLLDYFHLSPLQIPGDH